jgi:hypothetical protein
MAVEAQTGFRVQEHWLEMFGVCPACRKNESHREAERSTNDEGFHDH